MKHKIYKITNKINGKVYIGQTSETFRKRYLRHLLDVRNNSKYHFHLAIKKYGDENFTKEILEEDIPHASCLKSKELIIDIKEKEYIKKFDSYHNGYNMTVGGSGVFGYKHTDEIKSKLSSIQMGIKHSKERVEINRQAQLGKTLSEEHKLKISKSNKGKSKSELHKKNLQKPKKKIECPHCKMFGGSNAMKRYHFDNCKNILN